MTPAQVGFVVMILAWIVIIMMCKEKGMH